MHEREVDILIVGSGAGGGTVAQELAPLAAEGVRIAVLEWGPKLREEEFSGNELEMAKRLYFDSGGTLTKDRSLTLAAGRAYGGSTVVYTGTSLIPPPEVVERWDVPGLSFRDLEPRCAKFISQNKVHLLPEAEINDNNRLFKQGCEALGYEARQFPLNLEGCRGSSLCNLGCPNQAKMGTHRVQLPAAEAMGVEVITNCRVTRIAERSVTAEVENPDFGEPSPWEPGRYLVRAKIVVLAAGGAVNSPALLMRSGFGKRFPALGRYLSLHPALILVAEHDAPISNFIGHPKSYYCDHFVERERFLLETCMYFPFVTAKNLAGFGSEHSALMRAFPKLQMILVLALDEAARDNRVLLDREGQAVVDYTLSSAILDSLHRAMVESVKIFFAAGARRAHAPAGLHFFIDREDKDRVEELIPRRRVQPGRISITSAHLMGGCRMGRGAADSVTDSRGQVHGVPWLFVADASLFPSCSDVNPYLTVMALADRVAEGIRTRAAELLAVGAES